MSSPWTVLTSIAALCALSARWNWWRRPLKGLAVPMYHQIGNPPAQAKLKKLWVSAQDFRWQMNHLLKSGFTPMLCSEYCAALDAKTPMPERPALVTFDDGYADNYETAYPILKDLGIKANIFLVYEAIDKHNFFNDPKVGPWQRMMTWTQIRAMRDSGLVEFGSHTMTHPVLPELPYEEARWQIEESRGRLSEALDRPITAFAYPYGAGAYDSRIRELVRISGYRLDFGIRQGLSSVQWNPEQGPIKRLLVRGDDFKADYYLNLTRGKARL